MGSASLTSVAWSRFRPRSVIFVAVPGVIDSGSAITIRGLGSGGAFLSSCAAAHRMKIARVTLDIQFADRVALVEDLDWTAVRRV